MFLRGGHEREVKGSYSIGTFVHEELDKTHSLQMCVCACVHVRPCVCVCVYACCNGDENTFPSKMM